MRVKTHDGDIVQIVNTPYTANAVILLRAAQVQIPNMRVTCKFANGRYDLINVNLLNLEDWKELHDLNPGQ